MAFNAASWVSNYNDLFKLWVRESQEELPVLPMFRTEFGKWRWNSDVRKGMALLKNNAETIKDIWEKFLSIDSENLSLNDILSLYIIIGNLQGRITAPDGFKKDFEVVLKKINSGFWNWIYNFFTGASRLLKREGRKQLERMKNLDALNLNRQGLASCEERFNAQLIQPFREKFANLKDGFFPPQKEKIALEEMLKEIVTFKKDVGKCYSIEIREQCLTEIQVIEQEISARIQSLN